MTAMPYISMGRHLVAIHDQPGDCEDSCPCSRPAGWNGYSWNWTPFAEPAPWSWLDGFTDREVTP